MPPPLMTSDFLKPLVDRPHRRVVAQVPLAEDAGSIAGAGEHLGQGDFVGVHQRPAQVGVDHAGAIVVAAGQQAGSRRRTDRRDIEVLEPDALPGERVEVRRLDLGVAVNTQVAEALIVGDDHQDVRPPRAPPRLRSRLRTWPATQAGQSRDRGQAGFDLHQP